MFTVSYDSRICLPLGMLFGKCVKSHFYVFKSYLVLPCSSFSSNNRTISAVTNIHHKCPNEVFSLPCVVKSNKESKNIYFQILHLTLPGGRPSPKCQNVPLLIYLIAAPTLFRLSCHQMALCVRLFMHLFACAFFS